VGSQIRFLVEDATVSAPKVPLDHLEIFKRLMGGSAALCHPATMFRVDVARADLYRIQGPGQDFDFFLRMAESGILANHPDVLLSYRMHSRSSAMTNYGLIQRGIAFAVECANCRFYGRQEPEFDAFAMRWSNRSSLHAFCDKLHGLAAVQYRRSIIDRALGRPVLGAIRLGVAGLCQPRRAFNRLMQSQ
jgi:hypothetical protein